MADDIVTAVARRAGIPPSYYARILFQGEKSFKDWQTSPKGAYGPAQLMPPTAQYLERKYGVNTNTRAGNLQGGAFYAREMLDQFGGDPMLAAAAYNAGPGRVRQYVQKGRQLPAETRGYVRRVSAPGSIQLAGDDSQMSDIPLYPMAPPPNGPRGTPPQGAPTGLPPGFQLDDPTPTASAKPQAMPALPPGFQLDEPDVAAAARATPAESAQIDAAHGATASFSGATGEWEGMPANAQIGRGIRDIGQGVRQIAAHTIGTEDPAAVDAEIADIERNYQAARGGPMAGFDWWRTGGNVIATLPAAAVGGPMASGALSAALSPVTDDTKGFWGQKATQAAVGAAVGKGAQVAGGVVGGVVAPKVRASVQKLRELGVELTPGQMMGQVPARMEEKAMSLPILGDMIRSARRRQTEQLNVGILNMAAGKAGGKVSRAGPEGVDDTYVVLSGAYQNLLPKLKFAPDNKFMAEVAADPAVAVLSPDQHAQLIGIIKSRVEDRVAHAGGTLTGDVYKQVEHEFTQMAATPSELQPALKATLAALRRNLERANPGAEGEMLREINKGFATYAIMRDAVNRTGSKGGIASAEAISSAALQSAKKRMGPNVAARRGGLLQDVGMAAEELIGRKVPDSGTPERMMQALSGGGLLYYNPSTAVAVGTGLGVASIPYAAPVTRVLNKLGYGAAAERKMIREGIERASPLIGPTASAVANQKRPELNTAQMAVVNYLRRNQMAVATDR